MEKKLYLSDENKFVGGVCGGIGEYLGVDPTAVRLVSAVLTFMTAPNYIREIGNEVRLVSAVLTFMTGFIAGIVLYVVAMFIIPRKP